MKKPLERILGPCPLCGRMFYATVKARPPKYCWECARFARREATKLRVRAFRARQREAKVSASKQPDDSSSGLVVVGSREGTERATRPVPAGGLYASIPNPGRTQKRRSVGLP